MDKYKGCIKGLYVYIADNHINSEYIIADAFNVSPSNVRVVFRSSDLGLMFLVKLDNSTLDALILFTVDRFDDYTFNYDNYELLDKLLIDFKIGSRKYKIENIKKNIN